MAGMGTGRSKWAQWVEDVAEARRLARSLLENRRDRGGRRGRGRRRGMSLVEVMVVIAIILTLMGIVGFGVMQVFGDSQVDTTILQMGKVNERVQIYQLRRKSLPSGGDALREVYGGEDPPTDSWGNPFQLQVPGPNNRPYDIISLGSDGREGGTGNDADIRWSEVSN